MTCEVFDEWALSLPFSKGWSQKNTSQQLRAEVSQRFKACLAASTSTKCLSAKRLLREVGDVLAPLPELRPLEMTSLGRRVSWQEQLGGRKVAFHPEVPWFVGCLHGRTGSRMSQMASTGAELSEP